MERYETTLDRLIGEAIEQKVFPGAVCALLMGGRVVFQNTWGFADPETKRPTTPETLYDLASLTKPIATATALMIALERGMLTLEQALPRWFPDANHLKEVTLRHLATHTSGLPAWKPLYEKAGGREAVLDAVLEIPLERQPGTGYEYSDLGYILLGAVLGEVFKRSLAEIVKEFIAGPLGMNDTGYCPSPEYQGRIAPTAHCTWRPDRIFTGEVHDANAAAMGGVAGHAGLFSTLQDLIKYAQMISRGGPPLLSFYTVQQMLTPQVSLGEPSPGWHTLGWFAHPNGYLPRGDLFPTRCVGHSGFTGTVMLFDPQVELGLILLTNHLYYSAEKPAYLDYRRRILNVLAALAGRT